MACSRLFLTAGAIAMLAALGCKTPHAASDVKILNGVKMTPVPAIVGLSTPKGFCTGTFVNGTTVITAGHCVDLNDPAGNVTVVDMLHPNSSGAVAAMGKSVNAFVPPEFKTLTVTDPNYKRYDQAVLVFPEGTAAKLQITQFIEVASRGIRSGERFNILGYGAIKADASDGYSKDLLGGSNTVGQIDGDLILFYGAADTPQNPTGQNVSGNHGDSGGPMLDSSNHLVGTTEGGTPANGRMTNVYLSTTGNLARSLYNSAINCQRTPCAMNFPGSQTASTGGNTGGNTGGGTGGNTGGGTGSTGSLCGQATQNTKVCIDPNHTVVTILQVPTGVSAKYQVQKTANSTLLPGGIGYYGIADLSFIQGMIRNQQMTFIIHPDGRAKLVYWTAQGWASVGNVDTFRVTGN